MGYTVEASPEVLFRSAKANTAIAVSLDLDMSGFFQRSGTRILSLALGGL